MLANLQNGNIKYSSWLLKENRMCVFSKKVIRNGITFCQGKRSKSKLTDGCSLNGQRKWKKKWFVENGPREESFVHGTSF